MSDLTKNGATLHVHFNDDVLGNATVKPMQSIDENGRQHEVIDNNGTITLNYSRDDLLRLRNSLMAKRPPRFAVDESQIDDKRREKIRMVVKMNGGNNSTSSNKRTNRTQSTAATDSKDKMPLNESISLLPTFALGKFRENATDTVGGSPATVDAAKKDATDEKLPSDGDRLGFQQLMAAASGPNTANPFGEQANEQQTNSRRQRFGSGRITENLYNGGGLWNNGYRHSGSGKEKDVAFHLNYGVDYRGMNNDFFDKRHPVASNLAHNADRNNQVNGGERSDAYEWNKENNRFPQIPSRESSTEPEWVSCGPTSKHDVIELHGFEGPHADTDDHGKLKEAGSGAANSPPARSTPTKAKKNHEMPVKGDEHFNFEDFCKLELPSGNPMARGPGSSGESRFTQWFRRDSPPKKNAIGFDANTGKVHGSVGQSFASTEQFIDLMHKTHGKKIDSNLMASSAKFRSVEELEAELVPPAAAVGHAQQMSRQRQEQTKAANDLIEFRKLLTQMEQQIILQQHQQQQQNKANIVQQLYLLQQMNNTSYGQREREREALMALLNVCNDSFMPRFVPQQPPQFMGNIAQNFRQFQANIGTSNSPTHSPTQQELQFHTQAIMQNALLKKQQHQKQYQHSQQRLSMTPSPQPLYLNNQNYGQPQFRNNKVNIFDEINTVETADPINLVYYFIFSQNSIKCQRMDSN